MTIFHYPFHKSFTNKRIRKREKIYIEVEKSNAKSASVKRQENREAANFLRKRIILARENSAGFCDDQIVEDFEPKVRSLLLLINPAGGKGKAEELTQKRILPVLHEAGYKYEQKVTTHQGHAEELVWFQDLFAFSVPEVVCIEQIIQTVILRFMFHTFSSSIDFV